MNFLESPTAAGFGALIGAIISFVTFKKQVTKDFVTKDHFELCREMQTERFDQIKEELEYIRKKVDNIEAKL